MALSPTMLNICITHKENCYFDGIYSLDVFTSRPNVNASSTKVNVRSAITSWLKDSSDENDIVFIYYASHGGGYCLHDGGGGPDNWLPWAMAWGRYDVSSDEGNEISENNLHEQCLKLN